MQLEDSSAPSKPAAERKPCLFWGTRGARLSLEGLGPHLDWPRAWPRSPHQRPLSAHGALARTSRGSAIIWFVSSSIPHMKQNPGRVGLGRCLSLKEKPELPGRGPRLVGSRQSARSRAQRAPALRSHSWARTTHVAGKKSVVEPAEPRSEQPSTWLVGPWGRRWLSCPWGSPLIPHSRARPRASWLQKGSPKRSKDKKPSCET